MTLRDRLEDAKMSAPFARLAGDDAVTVKSPRPRSYMPPDHLLEGSRRIIEIKIYESGKVMVGYVDDGHLKWEECKECEYGKAG